MWNDPITSPFQTASEIGLHEKTWGPGSSYRKPVSYLFGLKKIQTRNRVDDRLSLSKMISNGEKKPSFVSTAESYFFIYDADTRYT